MKDDNTELRSIDESSRRNFESALRNGDHMELGNFLPAESDPTFLATLEELVLIEMEWNWKHVRSGDNSESPPLVEQFVKRFPQLDDSSVLVRLLRSEYELRQRFGDRPSSQHYRQRFPEVIKSATDITSGSEEVASASRQFIEGRSIGRYRLTNAHATGGFGVVWRAEDNQLGRQVALKHLRDRVAGDAHIRDRFMHEARITARLEHPGIVPVYEIGEELQESPFYTMKFVRGQTMDDAVRKLREEDASSGQSMGMLRLLNVFLAVARTTQYAHSVGVIHRDLKPQNVVVGEFGETIILDWGLARALHDRGHDGVSLVNEDEAPEQTVLGAIQGTPAYMSPEQAEGRTDKIDKRSDIYSLGAMLYQILTGRLPFNGTTSEEVLEQLRKGAPPSPRTVNRTVPRPLEAICLQALARSPDDRYQDVGELVGDLECYLADEKVSAWREPLHARAGRWMRRHRTMVTGIGAATAVLVISLAIGVVLLSSANQRERGLRALAETRETEALANFRLARRAVDQYLNQISADDQLKSQALEPLRRELLLAAKVFYEQLANQRPGDDALKYDQAVAHQRLAVISRELGRLDESIKSSRKAIELFGSLDRQLPNAPHIRDGMAGSHLDLGVTFKQEGRFEEAAREYESAISISRTLVEQHPDDRDLELSLVIALSNYGGMSLGSPLVDVRPNAANRHQQLEVAEESLSEAIRRCERMLKEQTTQPTDLEGGPRFLLAGALSNICLVYGRLERLSEARSSAERCIALRQAMLKQTPDSQLLRSGLAMVHVNLAAVWMKQKQWDRTLQHNRIAKKLFQGLMAKHGDVLRYRYLASSAAFNCAQALRYSNRIDESLDEYRVAIEMLQPLVQLNPQSLTYHEQLAVSAKAWADVLFQAEREADAKEPFRVALQSFRAIVEREPRHRNAMAYCALRLGGLAAKAGEVVSAEQSYQESIQLYQQLAEQSSNALLAVNLSTAQLDLGRLYSGQEGRDDETEEQYRAALLTAEQGLSIDPDNAALKDNYINCGDHLGRQLLFGPKKDIEQALAVWRSAIESYGDALERWPEKDSLHQSVAELHKLTAEREAQLKRHEQAIESYAAQQVILNHLLSRSNANANQIRTNLLNSFSQQGWNFQTLKDFEQAAAAYRGAIQICESLLEPDPKDQPLRYQVAKLWYSLATVYQAAQELSKAKDAFRTCSGVFKKLAADFPENETYTSAVSAISKKLKQLSDGE